MQALIDGMARCLFVTAYADQQEELADKGLESNCASSGQDWMDVAPDTPQDSLQEACILYGHIEAANKTNMACLLAKACEADGVEFPPNVTYENEFGHYITMMALGHGVGWFDDHEEFEIEIPNFEYHLY